MARADWSVKLDDSIVVAITIPIVIAIDNAIAVADNCLGFPAMQ